MSKSKELIVIAGPTASGKTHKAIEIALNSGIEIFSADSRQLYKEMNIGVAKPIIEELTMVKHHFINHISVEESYDVGRYENELLVKLSEYYQKADKAILVGGTGLYIQAAIEGLDQFPDVEDNIVNELNSEFEKKGLSTLVEELKNKDLASYETIDIQNSRRVIRALSIIRQTGQTFSSFKNKEAKEREFLFTYHYIDVPREELYDRINIRVDQMIKDGLEEEVRSLIKYKNLKSLQTVGYQEFFKYFDGEYSYEEAIDKIKQNSRNYAKRQMTWFRNKGFGIR